MTRLDSNAAWKEASGQVSTNRDVFLALAGVFFVVPSLALTVIGGEPTVVPGMQREAMMAAITAFYADAWWLILASAVLQVVGVLAILTLMRDRSHPTVGEAIRSALKGLLPYLVAQLLFALVVGMVGGIAIGLAAAVFPALAAGGAVLVFIVAMFIGVRLILVAPVIAVEGQRNPLVALKRSWTLTKGQFWRILGFLALVMILFLVVLGVVMLLVNVVLAIFASGETQRLLAAVVSSVLTAIAVTYVIGIIAAIHRQLAGPGTAGLTETFA